MSDDEELDAILKISVGCLVSCVIAFAGFVFILAAAIKWIIS